MTLLGCMDLFERTGMLAIGTRLRMMTDRVAEEMTHVYACYGLEIKHKWVPLIILLADGKSRSVTEIAREAGLSHPSVSIMVREMRAASLLACVDDSSRDKRVNEVRLSPEGLKLYAQMSELMEDTLAAIVRLSSESEHDLWMALAEWERLLSLHSLEDRIRTERRHREENSISIVPFSPVYREAFRLLNEEWIKKYFWMEEIDHQVLGNPEKYILEPGGEIFFALYQGEPVGACSLIKRQEGRFDYELSKLGVTSSIQGKGIGERLVRAVIQHAKKLGASRLLIETSTRLIPAVSLYRKLGFRDVPDMRADYERADVFLELDLQ